MRYYCLHSTENNKVLISVGLGPILAWYTVLRNKHNTADVRGTTKYFSMEDRTLSRPLWPVAGDSRQCVGEVILETA